jgi:formylglycine-generating enzyme required for sulfatase activity
LVGMAGVVCAGLAALLSSGQGLMTALRRLSLNGVGLGAEVARVGGGRRYSCVLLCWFLSVAARRWTDRPAFYDGALAPMIFGMTDAAEGHTPQPAGADWAVSDPPGPAPSKHMAWVPGGEFLMGSEDFYPEERPVHVVDVDGFWMDEHPVTVAEFRAS